MIKSDAWEWRGRIYFQLGERFFVKNIENYNYCVMIRKTLVFLKLNGKKLAKGDLHYYVQM